MGVVFLEGKILEDKVVNVGDCRVEAHHRLLARLAGELFLRLFKMIGVKMEIAKGMHKIPYLKTRHLSKHHGKQGIGGDVERHAEKDIGTSLVELTGKPALSDIKLEQAMAGR